MSTMTNRSMSTSRGKTKTPSASGISKCLANSQACGLPYKIPTAREMSNTTMLSEMKI